METRRQELILLFGFFIWLAMFFEWLYMYKGGPETVSSIARLPVDLLVIEEEEVEVEPTTQELVLHYSNIYGIDGNLVLAIMIHETGHFTSSAFENKNNPCGYMDRSNYSVVETFHSKEVGIITCVSNLKNNYFDLGLNTPELIGAKYAPIGADNDPNGLNNHWVSSITYNYNQLKEDNYE